MITLNDAVQLVREFFKNDYVCEVFEFDNEYVFNVLSRDYKNMHTNQGHLISVNRSTGDVEYFDMRKAFRNPEKFAKARKNSINVA